MKSPKLVLLFAIFSLFLLNSCTGDDEPIDPALLIPAPTPCDAPAFFNVSAFINNNTVRIEWDKTSGNEWEIQYGTNGFTVGTGTSVDFTATSSLINGLTSTVDYDFYIRTKCSDDDYSVWVGPVSPGTELELCSSPTNITAVRSTTDPTKVTVAWSGSSDGNSWQVQYGTAGFTIGSGTILASSTETKVIQNLLANVSYDFYVRSNCAANQNSAWVGPILVNAVGSSGCVAPTNLVAVRSASNGTQATLSWTASGSENSWEIQYGSVGFTAGNGTSVTSTTTTKIITGFQDIAYDFYVRAVCSGTQNSNWVGPITMASTGQAGASYYLRMKVNGVLKNFPLDQTGTIYSALSLQILSNDSNLINYFTLQLADLQAPGTYAFADPEVFATCSYIENDVIFASSYDDLTESPGNITVTELDLTNGRVKGTFNFIGKDDTMLNSRVITEGAFYLPFQ